MAVRHGVVMRLSELPLCAPGTSVRVHGALLQYDLHDGGRAVLAHREATLSVDLSHLPPDTAVVFRRGDAFQFLGELVVDAEGRRQLRARLARPFNGVDIGLYERVAIDAKRAFLRQVEMP